MPTCLQVLLFIANEGYAVGLAAALASVVQHTQPLPEIVVVDSGLSGQSKAQLSQVECCMGCSAAARLLTPANCRRA